MNNQLYVQRKLFNDVLNFLENLAVREDERKAYRGPTCDYLEVGQLLDGLNQRIALYMQEHADGKTQKDVQEACAAITDCIDGAMKLCGITSQSRRVCEVLEKAILLASERVEPDIKIYKEKLEKDKSPEKYKNLEVTISCDVEHYLSVIRDFDDKLQSRGYDCYESSEAGMESRYDKEDFDEIYRRRDAVETKVAKLLAIKEKLIPSAPSDEK